jgi:hypothetical protein
MSKLSLRVTSLTAVYMNLEHLGGLGYDVMCAMRDAMFQCLAGITLEVGAQNRAAAFEGRIGPV